MTQITYPSGRIVIYARDANGRITGVTTKQNATAAAVTVASSVVYQPMSSLVQSFTAGNGLTNWNTYTSDYELDLLGVYNGPAKVIERTHTRTDALNLTNIWDNVTTTNNQSYSYTAANRLQNTTGPWGATTNYYDGVGNRTQESSTTPGGSATTRTYTYPSTSNRLGNVKIGTTVERSFVYDAAGNVKRDTRSGAIYGYAYNNRNRLSAVSVDGVLKGTYRYNGLEQLTYRSLTNMTPSGLTHFIHDRLGNVIAETDGTGPAGTLSRPAAAGRASTSTCPRSDRRAFFMRGVNRQRHEK